MDIHGIIAHWMLAVTLIYESGWVGALLLLSTGLGLAFWGSHLTGWSPSTVRTYRKDAGAAHFYLQSETRHEGGVSHARTLVGLLGGVVLNLVGFLLTFVAVHAITLLCFAWLAEHA